MPENDPEKSVFNRIRNQLPREGGSGFGFYKTLNYLMLYLEDDPVELSGQLGEVGPDLLYQRLGVPLRT